MEFDLYAPKQTYAVMANVCGCSTRTIGKLVTEGHLSRDVPLNRTISEYVQYRMDVILAGRGGH